MPQLTCSFLLLWCQPLHYRGVNLEESLEYLQFMENAEEEEAWLGEKCAVVSRGDSGDTLAATQVKARQDGSTVSLLWFGSFFPNVAVFIHEIGSCILG